MGRQRAWRESSATFDTSALIAIDRGDRSVAVLIARAHATHTCVAVPAAVLAQAWRDGRTQARLSRFVSSALCDVVELDRVAARRAGHLCGLTGTSDVVDASVVVCAQDRGKTIVTADGGDLRRLDPRLRLVDV